MRKMKTKEIGQMTIVGAITALGTPLITGALSGVQVLSTAIVPGHLTIGTLVAATASVMAGTYIADQIIK